MARYWRKQESRSERAALGAALITLSLIAGPAVLLLLPVSGDGGVEHAVQGVTPMEALVGVLAAPVLFGCFFLILVLKPRRC